MTLDFGSESSRWIAFIALMQFCLIEAHSDPRCKFPALWSRDFMHWGLLLITEKEQT